LAEGGDDPIRETWVVFLLGGGDEGMKERQGGKRCFQKDATRSTDGELRWPVIGKKKCQERGKKKPTMSRTADGGKKSARTIPRKGGQHQ